VERGGRLVSKIYKDSYYKYSFFCVKGHFFKSAYFNIVHKNSWCPFCAGNAKLSIKPFQDWAKLNGGECVSTTYINNKSKLRFRCAEGHLFLIAPYSLHQGTGWCSECRRTNKQTETFNKLTMLINKLGYTMLSESYINRRTHLLVRCDKGHEWRARPDRIIAGGQCGECFRSRS